MHIVCVCAVRTARVVPVERRSPDVKAADVDDGEREAAEDAGQAGMPEVLAATCAAYFASHFLCLLFMPQLLHRPIVTQPLLHDD